ncbi:MAG: winged helix-turn-helix domain-containing protein, partial [Bryobacteraceae bacterium]|nr:winged helix-turn-helix domain-containing protein [Bryobacteraceae bacterium]
MSVTFTTRGALQKSVLRQANERLILNAVRNNPTISRSDLSRITGLSPSSISFIVNRLVRRGVLTEEKLEKYSQVGRR